MSNFSDRINVLFSKNRLTELDNHYLDIFTEEAYTVFDLISKNWSLNKSLDDLVKFWSYDKKSKVNQIATTEQYKDNGLYNLVINLNSIDYAWNHLLDDKNNKIYKTKDLLVRNAAAHEVSHIVANELTNSSGESKDHRSLWRSIYEPLRSRYTEVPLEISVDGKITNFSEYHDIKVVEILNRF